MASADFGSDPWAWLLVGALALGAGLGVFVRALVSAIRRDDRKATRRSVIGMLSLAVFVMAATGFLVFTDRSALQDRIFLLSALVIAGAGLLAGLLPRALGLPLVLACIAASILVASCLAGWLAIDKAARDGGLEIAVLTPFVVESAAGTKRMEGELTVNERDTVPTIQRVELPASEGSLVIERVELSGPLALVGGSSFYRVSGLSGAGSADIALPFDLESALIDRFLPLGPAPDAAAELPFARRWRETTEARPFAILGVLRYRLDTARSPGSQLFIAP